GWTAIAAGIVLAIGLLAVLEVTNGEIDWPAFADTSVQPLNDNSKPDGEASGSDQARQGAAVEPAGDDRPEDTEMLPAIDNPDTPESAADTNHDRVADAPSGAMEESKCLDELVSEHGRSNVVVHPLPDRLDDESLDGWCQVDLSDGRWVAYVAEGSDFPEKQVERVQEWLADRGELDEDGIDGILGPDTREALSAFQQEHGLVPTGEPDRLTRQVIQTFTEEKTG
ncbi:MAG: peptidoglycan-binding protein, partial [Thioalkalivibrio sp.]|nr:peptidoglycan-binding protein [Thioalkalivibrio sp.]